MFQLGPRTAAIPDALLQSYRATDPRPRDQRSGQQQMHLQPRRPQLAGRSGDPETPTSSRRLGLTPMASPTRTSQGAPSVGDYFYGDLRSRSPSRACGVCSGSSTRTAARSWASTGRIAARRFRPRPCRWSPGGRRGGLGARRDADGNASGCSGIASVQFQLDRVNIGSPSRRPYTMSWDSPRRRTTARALLRRRPTPTVSRARAAIPIVVDNTAPTCP